MSRTCLMSPVCASMLALVPLRIISPTYCRPCGRCDGKTLSERMNASDFANPNGSASEPPDRSFTLPAGVAMLLCLLLGLAGNLLILLVILGRRDTRGNLINLFITSLCINDLLNLLTNQSMVAVSYLAHGWVLGDLLCDLMPELNMLLVCVSLWHHALIGLHRYIVVVHRNAYLGMHKGLYSACMLVGTRLFAAMLSLSHPLFNGGRWFNMTTYQAKMLRCIYAVEHKSRIGVVVLLTQLLPCLIVIACFALIFVFVHRTGVQSTVADRLLLKRELQITKMFGAVFAMFLVGFLPYGCLRMLDSDNRLSPNAYVAVTLMYALASCTNPIVFGAMNTDIRTACLRMLGRRQRPRAKGRSGVSGVVSRQCNSGDQRKAVGPTFLLEVPNGTAGTHGAETAA